MLIVMAIVLGGTMITAIADRNRIAPIYGVHDIILQEEAAMRFFLQGKNPYKETYFGTPLEQWNYGELGQKATNPALYHFVMPPWYLLSPFFIYGVSIPFFGFFDGRMALLFCVVGLAIILMRWFKNAQLARLSIILTFLSPATVDYLIEGRSDVFALFWLLWSLYLLDRRIFFWSSVVFALALLSKQTIWFIVPFYFVATWKIQQSSWRRIVRSFITVCMTVSFFSLPFLLWDTKAFIDSVILYLSGGTLHGYPVSGYGLGMVLYDWHVIKNIHDYYPFMIWQIAIGLPLIFVLLRWIIKNPFSFSRMLISYGVLLFAVWYVSRYFNNSHLAYISSIFIVGVLKDWEERRLI